MHNLQHDRAILIACVEDLTDLARQLRGQPDKAYTYRNIVAEATRISVRLIEVQKQIEDYDLD